MEVGAVCVVAKHVGPWELARSAPAAIYTNVYTNATHLVVDISTYGDTFDASGLAECVSDTTFLLY